MTRNAVVFFLLLLTCVVRVASSADFETVSDLVANGFERVNNDKLLELIKTRHFEVRDIATGESYTVTRSTEQMGKNEAVTKTRSAKPGAALNPEVLARAPNLLATGNYSVDGDYIVVSDGTRSYKVAVYRKGEAMFGARDIDNGRVYFQLVPRTQ